MRDLETAIAAFVEQRDWDRFHSPKNLAMALSVEASEVVEIFQWLSEEQSLALDADRREALADELGDVLIYLVQLARKTGIDLLEAAHQKVEKNRRRYPAERVRGTALKYTEYEKP